MSLLHERTLRMSTGTIISNRGATLLVAIFLIARDGKEK